jgi:hypothetical protein
MLTRGLYSDSILVPEILHYAFEAPAGSRIVVRVTSVGVPRPGVYPAESLPPCRPRGRLLR